MTNLDSHHCLIWTAITNLDWCSHISHAMITDPFFADLAITDIQLSPILSAQTPRDSAAGRGTGGDGHPRYS